MTIARVVDVPDAVVRAVLDLRATTSDHQHPGWLPHATLARRVARADLPRALALLAGVDESFALAGLRRWDPDAGTVRDL